MSLDDDLVEVGIDDGLLADDAPPDRASQDPASDGPANHFADVYTFVEDYLVHVYARPVDRQRTTFRWCSQWYEHPEALARLDALWQAFEALRVTPGAGMSIWWVNHAEPTMAALTEPEGTFRACSDTTHAVPTQLPSQTSPARARNRNRAPINVSRNQIPP